jgi:hypothetical protein
VDGLRMGMDLAAAQLNDAAKSQVTKGAATKMRPFRWERPTSHTRLRVLMAVGPPPSFYPELRRSCHSPDADAYLCQTTGARR